MGKPTPPNLESVRDEALEILEELEANLPPTTEEQVFAGLVELTKSKGEPPQVTEIAEHCDMPYMTAHNAIKRLVRSERVLYPSKGVYVPVLASESARE